MKMEEKYSCITPYTVLYDLTRTDRIVFTCIDITISVMNLFTNAAVIYGIYASKQLKNTSVKFIFYLSICDCCSALISQPFFALILIHTFESKTIQCGIENASYFCTVFLTHTSFYFLIVIACDRLVRLRFLNINMNNVMNRKEKTVLLILICLSLLQASLNVFGIAFDFFLTAFKIGAAYDIFLGFTLFPIYLMGIIAARKHSLNMNRLAGLKRIDKVMTKVASRILPAVFICFFPYNTLSTMHWIIREKKKQRTGLEFYLVLSYTLTYCNAFINAIIFIALNKKVQQKLLKFFFRLHEANEIVSKNRSPKEEYSLRSVETSNTDI